jgi:HEAT repeat protein
LLKAVDDENPRVRIEAMYTLGALAPSVAGEDAQALIKALDHYDPAIRAAAARVAGRLRVAGAASELARAVNDSQQPVRFAAMRALGEIREKSAVDLLATQVEHYRRGEGAWSALDALAKIGDPASVPLFKARLTDRDQYLRRAAAEGLGRAGDASETAALETGITKEGSPMVRAAMAFALVKLGRDGLGHLTNLLDDDRLVAQVADYLIELGPSSADALVSRLEDPKDAIRGNAALILGAVGTSAHVPALQELTKDRQGEVRQAAERAIERIKLRGA